MGKNLEFSEGTFKVFNQIMDLQDFVAEYGSAYPEILLARIFKFDLNFKPAKKVKPFKAKCIINLPSGDMLTCTEKETTIWTSDKE